MVADMRYKKRRVGSPFLLNRIDEAALLYIVKSFLLIFAIMIQTVFFLLRICIIIKYISVYCRLEVALIYKEILSIELKKKMDGMLQQDEGARSSPEYTEMLLRHMLKEWGFNPYLIGFEYLIQSVMACYLDKELLKYKTKVLYPTIAKRYCVAAENVIRNIRTLIHDFWKKPARNVFCRCTDCWDIKDCKEPSCSKMIDILAKYLRKKACGG